MSLQSARRAVPGRDARCRRSGEREVVCLVGVGGGEAVDLWAGWSWIPEYHSSGELCIPSSSPLFLSLSFPFLPWVVGDELQPLERGAGWGGGVTILKGKEI